MSEVAFQKFSTFTTAGSRIHDPEIDHRIHRGGHVVAGHDFLLGDVDGYDPQIHLHHAVHERDEENQARPFGVEQFAEAEDDAALVFAQNADRLGQNDYRQNDQHDNRKNDAAGG